MHNLIKDDCISHMQVMKPDSVDLVWTSPPYYNARDYSTFVSYSNYLQFMEAAIRGIHRVLKKGRFFVLNSSPVLIPRISRSHSSKRLPIPFDLNAIAQQCGFDYIDDIIWEKPEGAGWSLGRGRRFSADRSPLQYKPVPVTEYLFVYRKSTDELIDSEIRRIPKSIRESSKIDDPYDVTNIWKVQPETRSKHPAPFPLELAKKVVRYYSFKKDLVLDPFAGSGTTGVACLELDRDCLLIERDNDYCNLIKERIPSITYLESK